MCGMLLRVRGCRTCFLLLVHDIVHLDTYCRPHDTLLCRCDGGPLHSCCSSRTCSCEHPPYRGRCEVVAWIPDEVKSIQKVIVAQGSLSLPPYGRKSPASPGHGHTCYCPPSPKQSEDPESWLFGVTLVG
ncbi:hypothetical protein FA13DRAFT_1460283 [Coprinellus micaceus]|uniref:Uncharacterized protein n=1 Tax=Coprinellus micaceus TaxID=71717 RepID=A0A4Y7SPC9_COPMI|nr:hypothetical protein FA13DRAFT_1460283 [Coprinellus micaceus]